MSRKEVINYLFFGVVFFPDRNEGRFYCVASKVLLMQFYFLGFFYFFEKDSTFKDYLNVVLSINLLVVSSSFWLYQSDILVRIVGAFSVVFFLLVQPYVFSFVRNFFYEETVYGVICEEVASGALAVLYIGLMLSMRLGIRATSVKE